MATLHTQSTLTRAREVVITCPELAYAWSGDSRKLCLRGPVLITIKGNSCLRRYLEASISPQVCSPTFTLACMVRLHRHILVLNLRVPKLICQCSVCAFARDCV
jgi:hypothetical protein